MIVLSGSYIGIMEREVEEICRTRVWELAGAGRIPFRPQRVGPWWDAQAQIDVAALDEEYLLLGECRWRSRPLGPDALTELRRKAERVPGARHQLLALFSRAGFTEPLQAEAASQGVLLYQDLPIASISRRRTFAQPRSWFRCCPTWRP